MARRFEGGRLVVASHNAGKVHEIGLLLAPYGVETVSAAELSLPEPEETGTRFEDNARIKSHAAASATGLPALSDDSGIEIDALDGAPGVYTADWADTGAGQAGRDYPAAMARAHAELVARGAPEPWVARFVCVLSLAWPDGHDETLRGTAEGRVVWPARGTHGFGFDPMFVPDGHAETFAEMAPDRKHSMSHRADAFVKLVAACFAD
ncbi:MAG: non-canonical purine NTP pyrophosphatase [Pseudomonadota bacterium]